VRQLLPYRTKILANAQVKIRKDISLGDLRDKFSPQHHQLPPSLTAMAASFKRYRSRANKPLVIFGSDGGLLVCRVRMNDPQITENLFTEIEALPQITKQHRLKGIVRSGEHEARHYGLWCPYAKIPFITSEQKLDGEKGEAFLKSQKVLFGEMSDLLGAMAPGVFKDFKRFSIVGKEGPLERPCGAWSACVINRGWNNPLATNIHRDVKESQFGYSCIAPCGNYKDGDLIMWDLRIKIEIVPGDLLLFPDSLIHHSNEAVKGTRRSIVMFTQENMNDYWKREFGMNLKRHQKKKKKISRKVIGKRMEKN
jgi:hypothetical protein